MGVGAAGEELRRGLKTRTRTSAKIMSKRRKMHFRLPVFFWYLSSTGTRNRKGDEGGEEINQSDFNRYQQRDSTHRVAI
jgi:hypothetical protein